MNLLCFGLGYSATHYIAEFGQRFDRIAGTVTDPERAASLTANGIGGHAVEALAFDGSQKVARIAELLADSDTLLVSAPPDRDDPVLRQYEDRIASSPRLSVVYLSTIGVYGDAGGGWVAETSPEHPRSERSRARLAAEKAWTALGVRARKSVAILRLAGIYGPGQNVLLQVARGTARRVVKPGQIFNRIHVADIAQAIDAALVRRASGVFNVADDEPTPPAEPIAFAAELLGVPPPPEIAFEEAAKTMSPMALSFWVECRRARNDKLERELGVRLRYPTYREGLTALLEAGEGRST